MKAVRTVLIYSLALTILLSACGSKPPPASSAPINVPDTLQGNIAISGAFALYPMMTRWAEEYQKIHPKVQFDISGGGAGKGMTDVLSGAVDIGMVSRDVKPEEVSQGAYSIGVVKDAVFAVISTKNPILTDIQAAGITKDTFRKIFITGEVTTWGQVIGKLEVTDAIHVYTRSDSAGAADVWAQYLGGKGQADLKGIGVNADPGLLDAVVKDPLGIGYNNLGYAFDQSTGKLPPGAYVVPIDTNQNGKADPDEILTTLNAASNAVATGKYPSPPARVLNLVTKGKPSGLVLNFIHWILTDGQVFISEAGFVQLPADVLKQSLDKVK